MHIKQRMRPALRACLKHLLASCGVALACAALVFGVWYPHPFSELVGGRELFLLVVSVDVVSGPLLTLIVFDPRKPPAELWRDVGVVVLLQVAALGYGFFTVMEARPVFLAFEGDRFRVVRVPDIDMSQIESAPKALRQLSLSGPRLLGVRLAKSTDPDFPRSIELAMQGVHPAFRPSRWVNYAEQRSEIVAAAKPLALLRSKHQAKASLVDKAVLASKTAEQRLGFLPLFAASRTDWVVIVSLDDALPKAYLPLDAF